MFHGTQTGSVDEKYRLKMPSAVRHSLLDEYSSGDFFVTSLDGKQVRVYPVSEWDEVERKLTTPSDNADPHEGTRRKKILRRANHYGADASLDNQGRILIPGSLREDSGVRGEVFLQWSGNHLLVIGAAEYNRQLAELDQDDLEFADKLGV